MIYSGKGPSLQRQPGMGGWELEISYSLEKQKIEVMRENGRKELSISRIHTFWKSVYPCVSRDVTDFYHFQFVYFAN